MRVEHKKRTVLWPIEKFAPIRVALKVKTKKTAALFAHWLRRPRLSPAQPHSKTYGR
jgi:hypothetical protein